MLQNFARFDKLKVKFDIVKLVEVYLTLSLIQNCTFASTSITIDAFGKRLANFKQNIIKRVEKDVYFLQGCEIQCLINRMKI